MSLHAHYADVVRRIAGRATLVAVSKAADVEAMRAVYDLGQRDFGENRVEALVEKRAQMPKDVRWHFIGNLQSNKIRTLRELRPLVHSFDRVDLATKWGDMPLLLQVDFTGRSALGERNGLPPADIPSALATLADQGVPVLGLSTLPPKEGDPRAAFRALASLAKEHGLRELSMGMSDDFEAALAEGATMVRVGRAIFG